MEETKFMEICARVLQKQPEALELDNDLVSVGWDSLANVEFVAELDDELGIQLDSERLSDCATLGAIFALVNAAV